jgi:hypothetical protein
MYKACKIIVVPTGPRVDWYTRRVRPPCYPNRFSMQPAAFIRLIFFFFCLVPKHVHVPLIKRLLGIIRFPCYERWSVFDESYTGYSNN